MFTDDSEVWPEGRLRKLIDNHTADCLWECGFDFSLKPLAAAGCPFPTQVAGELWWPGHGWQDCMPEGLLDS